MWYIFYIILITPIKCHRIRKDGWRDSNCVTEPMDFGQAFKELTFKMALEKLLGLFQAVDGKCGKEKQCICKACNVAIWRLKGVSSDFFFFIVLTLNMCPVHLLNLDTINTSEIVWESGREFKFIRWNNMGLICGIPITIYIFLWGSMILTSQLKEVKKSCDFYNRPHENQ